MNWYSKGSRRMSKKASSINQMFGSSISSGCSTRKTTSTSDERDGGSAGDAGCRQRVVVLMVATAGMVRKRRRWRRWRLHPAELLTVKSTATALIDPIIGSLEILESWFKKQRGLCNYGPTTHDTLRNISCKLSRTKPSKTPKP